MRDRYAEQHRDDVPATSRTAGATGDARPGLDPASRDPDLATGGAAPSGSTTRDRDGRSWRIGTDADVAWITTGTTVGLSVASALPRVFQAYATVVVPELGTALVEHEQRVLRLLTDHSQDRDWWLGYLETGVSDLVFPDAPRVRMYSDWRYVLVQAGPEQALRWRADPSPLHCRLPDLMFPTDRTWLISALWDDDWWCLGGPEALVDAFVGDPGLEVRRVDPDGDATPPGHVAR